MSCIAQKLHDREAGYVEGLIAQIKDDLFGATKGGRVDTGVDTEARLNMPLIQRAYAHPEDALGALKTARRKREAAGILTAYCL